METTEELRETREAIQAHAMVLANQISSMVGRAKAEGRPLTEREKNQCRALEDRANADLTEAENVSAEIVVAERTGTPSFSSPSMGRMVPPQPLAGGSASASRAIQMTGGPTFANMFPGAPRRAVNAPFKNLGEFALAVFQGDPRLHEIRNTASGASEGVAGDGGFYLPMEQYAGLMDNSLQAEAIRPGATIIPMTSSSISIPMFDLSNRSTGIATLEGKATGEGATGSTQKAKVREVLLTAKKIQVLVPATIELLQDAPAIFNVLLQRYMTEALGQTLDSWFISGIGAGGAPLGILNAPCTVSVAKESTQVAATINPDNIAKMVSRLAPGSWARAVWLCSPSALAQLFTMRIVVTTVAGSENVGGFQPAFFQVLPDGTFSLLGRPLIVSDRCAALGTVGDILLVDRQSYLIGLRQDATLDISRDIGFKESEIWFRLNCRIDGQPCLNAPITPRVGSATLSPFVSLATRS